ncbi:MAG: translocation/assembly module TamB, partial [Luteimonas sp.]|nr:translocation/assembly module TamB [Luteimonas sp.]
MSRPSVSDHDTAIAELRARRRARVRVLVVRSAFTTLGLLLLAAVLLYWLLMTVGGRDVLLSQIVARLPADTTLTWRSAEGPASGPLTLRDVSFETPTRDRTCSEAGTEDCPITGRIVFFARTIVLDPAIRPLFGRRLRLDALDIAGATLDLPKSDEPFELPRWPEVLPEIAPPLALQADTIRIDGFKVTQARETLIDIHRLRGGLDASTGRLHIERVRIDSDRGRFALHGDYAPEDDYRTDLTASAVLPAPSGRTAPKLGLVARGELSTMDVALSGNVPAPLRATLTLRAPATAKDVPRWTLRANSTALELGLLTGSDEVSAPLAFDVRAGGTGGQARLQGKFTQGEFTATILPSKLRLDNQVLDVQPLALQVFDGTAVLRGRADFRDANNRKFRFAINARGLTWGGAATTAANPTQAATDTPAIVADADLGFAGTVEAWAAIGKATLVRDSQSAAIDFDGRGDAQRMTLKTLRATMPTGTLDGSGSLAWAPALGWDIDATLAGFDPGYFAADWKGAVNGELATRGTTRADGGLDVAVDASQLGGRLRGRPLQGRGRFLMR